VDKIELIAGALGPFYFDRVPERGAVKVTPYMRGRDFVWSG